MVEEVGWDSEKLGYTGLIEVANRLMIKGKSALETEQSAVRVLQSLFPPLLLVLFKALLAPIANGQLASIMVARATALSCQWLMGPCSVNSVTLSDGKSLSSGVFVEKCKYLEESKCLGICINTCKLPTQTFFKDYMGVDLYMEPNFEDYSCQFNFGVPPPSLDTDKALKEPCLDICTNARRRKELGTELRSTKLPPAGVRVHRPHAAGPAGEACAVRLYYLAGEKGRDMGKVLPPAEGISTTCSHPAPAPRDDHRGEDKVGAAAAHPGQAGQRGSGDGTRGSNPIFPHAATVEAAPRCLEVAVGATICVMSFKNGGGGKGSEDDEFSISVKSVKAFC
ncbi:hypothetical protein ABZP36_029945 [Zizania latifolia]